jgi:hypothetical protein
MHPPHRMALDELSQLAFEGGEVTGLDFDELSTAPQVNLVAFDARFHFIAGAGVPRLERRVQRGFAERADGMSGVVVYTHRFHSSSTLDGHQSR